MFETLYIKEIIYTHIKLSEVSIRVFTKFLQSPHNGPEMMSYEFAFAELPAWRRQNVVELLRVT